MSDSPHEIRCPECNLRCAKLLETEFPNKAHLIQSVQVKHIYLNATTQHVIQIELSSQYLDNMGRGQR